MAGNKRDHAVYELAAEDGSAVLTIATFNAQMNRLVGLKFMPADLTTHWEALSDLPDAVLEAAVTRAQKTRADFPTPVELRQDADQVKAHAFIVEPAEDRVVALAQPFTITVPEVGTVVSVTREWRYYADRCSDTGWASWWCGTVEDRRAPWMPISSCGRRGDHDAHEWVGQCACWESNPALVRKREAQRKYAEKPGRAA